MSTPGGRRKRGKPTDCTLPGDPKKTKETEEVCLICDGKVMNLTKPFIVKGTTKGGSIENA